MRSCQVLTTLAIFATGAHAIGSSFTFYEDPEGEDMVQYDNIDPDYCVSGENGIRSVKVDEGFSFGDTVYCITWYKEEGCNEKDKMHDYPWDSDDEGDELFPFGESAKSALVISDGCEGWGKN